MTYIPNFNDPRIKRRCETALAFVAKYIDDKPIPVSKTQICRHFGELHRPLGAYLKELLLVCVDSYYNFETHQCKKYVRNQEGYRFLKSQFKEVKISIDPSWEQALQTDSVEYTEKNGRAYHPLQNLPKRIKRPLLGKYGFRYEYDIQSCAQTLLLQLAQKQGFNTPTPCLTALLEDRHLVRNQLSQELGLSPDVIKQCLHAMLNGAVISTWHTSAIFAYVNYNSSKIDQLKAHPWIQQYKEEVRLMWLSIRPMMSLNKAQRLNAKKKSEMYRELEGEIRRVIVKSLNREKNKHFFEHDGWTCEKAIDIEGLCSQVKRATGYSIKLDWTIIEYVSCFNNTSPQHSIIL